MIWGQSLNSQTDIPRFGNPQPLPSVRPPQSSGLPSVQWPARQPLQSLAPFLLHRLCGNSKLQSHYRENGPESLLSGRKGYRTALFFLRKKMLGNVQVQPPVLIFTCVTL